MASDTWGSNTLPPTSAPAETGEPVFEGSDPAPLTFRGLRSKRGAYSLNPPDGASALQPSDQGQGSVQASTPQASTWHRGWRLLALVFAAGAATALGGAYLLEVLEQTDLQHLQPWLPSVTVHIQWPEAKTDTKVDGRSATEEARKDAAARSPLDERPPDSSAASARDVPQPATGAQGALAGSQGTSTPAPPQTSSPDKDLSSGQLASLLVIRGDEAMMAGDIITARRFYERAAEAGVAGASTRVGRTYDPIYLRQLGVRGLLADPNKARQWYEQAAVRGDLEARTRLNLLEQSADVNKPN
jgi:Sel1 repeat-containing protein